MREIEDYLTKYQKANNVDRETALTHAEVKAYIEYIETRESETQPRNMWTEKEAYGC